MAGAGAFRQLAATAGVGFFIISEFRDMAMNTATAERREHPEKQSQNIQDGFLNSARKERALVTIYLVSGVKLTGRIRSFDKFSLILESNHQEQLIFKHAISTVVMPRPGAPPVSVSPSP